MLPFFRSAIYTDAPPSGNPDVVFIFPDIENLDAFFCAATGNDKETQANIIRRDLIIFIVYFLIGSHSLK
jgi:hypothetical protein